MRIAVTGATGHLGSVLVTDLLEEGHELKVLIHTNTQSIAGLPVTRVKGSVSDAASVDELLKEADAVIHCAALISITGDQYGLVQKTNVDGVKMVLEAAIKNKVKKYIHVSSIHAYNQLPSGEPLNEARNLVGDHASIYDQSKRDGQLNVLRCVESGLDATIVNPTSIVGPPDYRPSLMGQAIIDLCNGKVPAIIPGGFDFVDVRDVSKGIIGALKSGRKGENYLLSGKWYAISDIAKMLSVISGRRINPPKIPVWAARAGVPFIKLWSKVSSTKPLYTNESITALVHGNRKIEATKAKEELGFVSRPFEETLHDVVKWFHKNGMIKK